LWMKNWNDCGRTHSLILQYYHGFCLKSCAESYRQVSQDSLTLQHCISWIRWCHWAVFFCIRCTLIRASSVYNIFMMRYFHKSNNQVFHHKILVRNV
jgi:hypothetical protein